MLLIYALGNHNAVSLQNSDLSLFLGIEGTGFIFLENFILK